MSTDGTLVGGPQLRAIVTGGASGIGHAVVARLVGSGADVVSLDVGAPQEPIASVGYLGCDITDADAVEVTVAQATELLGGLDVVVCNAGIGASGTVADNDDAEWARVFDVNVFGHVRVVRAALGALKESSSACIVTTCSIVAEVGLPNRALYSSSKGALLALTMSMAVDLLPDGIRVNAVCPGTTDTPWVQRLLAEAPDRDASRRQLLQRQPTGRLVTAEEVASAVAYLVHPDARSTTGTVIYVDGGLARLRPPH